MATSVSATTPITPRAFRLGARVKTLVTTALLLICMSAAGPGFAEQTQPKGMKPLFQLNPTSAGDLAEQTRTYPTDDRDAVIDASAAALQDMGYKLTGGERQLGLLVGHKHADVEGAGAAHAMAEAAVVTISVLASLLTGQDMVTDLPEQVGQVIYISLLVSEASTSGREGTEVRISLDRDMIYDHGGIIADHTELPLIYQEFFGRVSKAIYLEGEKL